MICSNVRGSTVVCVLANDWTTHRSTYLSGISKGGSNPEGRTVLSSGSFTFSGTGSEASGVPKEGDGHRGFGGDARRRRRNHPQGLHRNCRFWTLNLILGGGPAWSTAWRQICQRWPGPRHKNSLRLRPSGGPHGHADPDRDAPHTGEDEILWVMPGGTELEVIKKA